MRRWCGSRRQGCCPPADRQPAPACALLGAWRPPLCLLRDPAARRLTASLAHSHNQTHFQTSTSTLPLPHFHFHQTRFPRLSSYGLCCTCAALAFPAFSSTFLLLRWPFAPPPHHLWVQCARQLTNIATHVRFNARFRCLLVSLHPPPHGLFDSRPACHDCCLSLSVACKIRLPPGLHGAQGLGCGSVLAARTVSVRWECSSDR